MINMKRWLPFLAFILILGLGYGGYELSKKTVYLSLDGDQKTMRTHANTVEAILESLAVPFDEHDHITLHLDEVVTNGMHISWVPTKKVILQRNENSETFYTDKEIVADLLTELEITLAKHDKLNVSLDEKINDNIEIVYEKAFPVFITYGKESYVTETTTTTVGELLEREHILLDERDRINLPLHHVLQENEAIVITIVEDETEVLTEEIPYSVITKPDSSLEKGKERIVQNGVPGQKEKRFTVRIENGEVVSKTLEEEQVIQKPIDQIISIGTKEIKKEKPKKESAPPPSRGEPIGKEFTVQSTAYSANCTGCSGITATGFDLHKNPEAKVIAVDPSVIPLGTKVYVEGYGYAVAADTGGAIKGKEIDVFFSTKEKVNAWGRKTVKIRILD